MKKLAGNECDLVRLLEMFSIWKSFNYWWSFSRIL